MHIMAKTVFLIVLILVSCGISFAETSEWTVKGRASNEFGQGMSGLKVIAFDKDLTDDDELGMSVTDKNGSFIIKYKTIDFNDSAEASPDLYLKVLGKDRTELYNSRDMSRLHANRTEYFNIIIKSQINLKTKPIRLNYNY